MRHFLTKILTPRCKRVEQAGSAAEAVEILDRSHFDLVVLDNVMPGKTGLDWLREQRKVGFFSDAILITAYADLETAIDALRIGGVADFVLKPFRANQILNAVARALDRKILRRDNSLLRHELLAEGSPTKGGRLLGKSPPPIEEVRRMLGRLAPMPTPVLFTGPPSGGTGKEVAARTLHALSDRADKPFVAVNCAAVASDRCAQEFFGMTDGREGGNQDGLFLLADGGGLVPGRGRADARADAGSPIACVGRPAHPPGWCGT